MHVRLHVDMNEEMFKRIKAEILVHGCFLDFVHGHITEPKWAKLKAFCVINA